MNKKESISNFCEKCINKNNCAYRESTESLCDYCINNLTDNLEIKVTCRKEVRE